MSVWVLSKMCKHARYCTKQNVSVRVSMCWLSISTLTCTPILGDVQDNFIFSRFDFHLNLMSLSFYSRLRKFHALRFVHMHIRNSEVWKLSTSLVARLLCHSALQLSISFPLMDFLEKDSTIWISPLYKFMLPTHQFWFDIWHTSRWDCSPLHFTT